MSTAAAPQRRSGGSIGQMMLNKLGVGPRDSGSSGRKSTASGRNSHTDTGDSDARGRSMTDRPLELDKEWMVGGKYEVLSTLGLYNSVELQGAFVSELWPKEVFLLLQIKETGNGLLGLVLPPAPRCLGWVPLEDPQLASSGSSPILRRHLPNSWKMKSRYRALHPATLRSGPLLESEWVGEVSRDDEVLVLELGVNADDIEELVRDTKRKSSMESRTRLRMLISTDTGLLGWMSPETTHGEQLLDPVNLLSAEAMSLSRGRRSVSSAAGRASGSQAHGSRPSVGSQGSTPAAGRLSEAHADVSTARPPEVVSLPWKVGGHYRMFEDQPLLADLTRGAAEVLKIRRGSILHIGRLDYQQCPGTGWCPLAMVTVQDGDARGHQGWVRCISKDGYDLLDTRDQLQFDRVTQQIERERQRRTQLLEERLSVQKAQEKQQAPAATPAAATGGADTGGADASSRDEESSAEDGETESAVSSSAVSATEEPTLKAPAAAGAKGSGANEKAASEAKEAKQVQSLQDLEVGPGREELNVMDGGTIQDEGWGSCLRCTCGAAGRGSAATAPAPVVAKAN